VPQAEIKLNQFSIFQYRNDRERNVKNPETFLGRRRIGVASAGGRVGLLPPVRPRIDKEHHENRMTGEGPWRPFPTTPSGTCRDWSMRMKCGLCDRVGTYRLVDLADLYGRHHTVAEIVSRLPCQTFHRGSVDVQLISTDPDGSSNAVRIPM
jgi:hypothetical protein